MKKNLLMNKTTILALSAVVLLGASAIGSTSAARTQASNEAIVANFETAEVATSLVKTTADGATTINSSDNILSDITEFHVGQSYPEAISFVNGQSYEAYARVTITKSWLSVDSKGVTVKDQTLDPSLIEITLPEAFSDTTKWYHDTTASTAEREVYYYLLPVATGASVQVLDSVLVDDALNTMVSSANASDGVIGNITTTYDYNGKSISLGITVDEIQTHNAVDAALASWGVYLTVGDNGITSVSHDVPTTGTQTTEGTTTESTTTESTTTQAGVTVSESAPAESEATTTTTEEVQ